MPTATFTAPDLATARANADAWVRRVDPHDQLPQEVKVTRTDEAVTIRVTVGDDE